MSSFRPLVVPAARYFFTVRLKDPQSDLLTRHIVLLRHAVLVAQKCHPFAIENAVIMPSMLHMIWSMPSGDGDYGLRWQQIKTTFARHVPYKSRGRATPGIWQRRYWEHPIQTAADHRFYADTIAQAPVEAGLVKQASDWPYSSHVKLQTQVDPHTFAATG